MKSRDIEILDKLKGGSPSAYKELFDFYYLRLTVYSLKYCDSYKLAEDIVQDLFVKLWDEKLYMKLNGNMSPYLFKAVKNNTVQAMKKKSKYRFEKIENQVNNLMVDEKVDFVSIEEETKKLHQEVEYLPEKCKEVFKAIVLENMKYREVAESFGISINTVKTYHARALKQLRGSLG